MSRPPASGDLVEAIVYTTNYATGEVHAPGDRFRVVDPDTLDTLIAIGHVRRVVDDAPPPASLEAPAPTTPSLEAPVADPDADTDAHNHDAHPPPAHRTRRHARR
jgi:hypothetical protein